MRRREFLIGIPPSFLLISGCSGKASGISKRDVVNNTDGFAVRNVRDWASGSAIEYKATVVIDGDVRNISDTQKTLPAIAGRFYTSRNERLATVDADFKKNGGWKAHAEMDTTLSGGESVDFRIIHTPETGDTEYYDLVVG